MQWKCANDLSSHESTTILLCRACSRPGATWSTSSTKDRYSVPARIMELKCGGPWTWTCRMDRLCTCDMSPQPEYACVGSSRPLPHAMMKLNACDHHSYDLYANPERSNVFAAVCGYNSCVMWYRGGAQSYVAIWSVGQLILGASWTSATLYMLIGGVDRRGAAGRWWSLICWQFSSNLALDWWRSKSGNPVCVLRDITVLLLV